jgi:4-hydroxyphenylacetate 3-monooxygenase/anthranilate 3-monooxygenase (FAD)/4-hydroxyphenylacetate 3-monooxygenase
MGPAFPGTMTLQAVIRGTVKLRFLTGLACLVARAIGRTEMPRYQEMLGELIGSVELAEGLLTASAHEVLNNFNHPIEEQDTGSRAASRGVLPGVGTLFGGSGRGMLPITAIRLFFPQAMTRAIDTIRLMGSSGLILTPTEKDLAHPDVREALAKYLRGKDMAAEERLQIMKMAWDVVGTEFGGRQFMYEWFFAGDPFGSRIVYSAPGGARNVKRWRGVCSKARSRAVREGR